MLTLVTLFFGFLTSGCVTETGRPAATKHEITQRYFSACDAILIKAEQEAAQAALVGTRNDIMIAAARRVLEVNEPVGADAGKATEYRRTVELVLKGYQARVDWRTYVAYTGVGLAAGAADFAGGAGAAITAAAAGLKLHADMKEKEVKQAREATIRWQATLRETGYESAFWPSFTLNDT